MTTIKDAPIVELLIGTEKFPISDGSGKPVTATIQLIIDKCGIPLVEELDLDAPLGTLVRYKQTVVITKEETVIKPGSIRDLNQNLEWDYGNMPNFSNLDIISDINFKMPSRLPKEELEVGFVLGSINMITPIMVRYYDSHYYVEALNPMNGGWVTLLDYEVGIYQSNIKWLEYLLGPKIYYLGTGYSDELLTEELFDLIDLFFTFTSKGTITTTEEITKVAPYIKQQHGWESLITENSDFNNDFNLDFN